MTVESEPETGKGKPVSRWRGLMIALFLVVVTIVWLLLTARERSDEPQQFFGLWRVRHVAIALCGLWLATAILASAISRKACFKWLIVSFSVGLALLLVEAAGLVGAIDVSKLRKIQQINPYGAKRLAHVDVSGNTCQDIWTRWGMNSPAMPFHFKTDARGFRNDKDRDAADIYLLGDSILVAGLVPFEQTVTSKLESDLGRPVMNISLIGLSVQAERDLLIDANPPLRGRLVLHFVFEGNDALDSRAYRQRKDSTNQPVAKKDWKGRSPTYILLLKLQDMTQPVSPLAARRTGYIDDQPYGFVWVAEMVRGLQDEFPYILAALADTRKFVESAGGRYTVVVVPEKYRVLAPLCSWPSGSDLPDYQANLSPLSGVVTDWCRREGVPVLELLPALQNVAREGRIPWFAGDTHLNENGHAAAAEAIAVWLNAMK